MKPSQIPSQLTGKSGVDTVLCTNLADDDCVVLYIVTSLCYLLIDAQTRSSTEEIILIRVPSLVLCTHSDPPAKTSVIGVLVVNYCTCITGQLVPI